MILHRPLCADAAPSWYGKCQCWRPFCGVHWSSATSVVANLAASAPILPVTVPSTTYRRVFPAVDRKWTTCHKPITSTLPSAWQTIIGFARSSKRSARSTANCYVAEKRLRGPDEPPAVAIAHSLRRCAICWRADRQHARSLAHGGPRARSDRGGYE